MKHEAILACLKGCLLPEWEAIPDFGLYMDQVITFVGRSFPGIAGRLDLTPSMINNYVKAGMIDKPSGKKYSRDALAQLLMIIQLKLTTPMEIMKILLHPENEASTKDLYALFRKYQDQVIEEFRLQEDAPRLMYALKSSSLQLIMRLSDEACQESVSPSGGTAAGC